MYENVKAWYDRLPRYEKDLPLLIVDSKAYTPRTALSEVRSGSSLGDRLQGLIESGSVGSPEEDETLLAKIRLREKLRKKDPDKPLLATLRPIPTARAWTARQLLEAIEQETEEGLSWIAGERAEIHRVVRL